MHSRAAPYIRQPFYDERWKHPRFREHPWSLRYQDDHGIRTFFSGTS